MVNAFWLDRDLERAAAWLVDRHVLSSIVECALVLTTAVQLNGYPDPEGALYYSHADHPLTRWAAERRANWRRLRAYVEATHDEWRYRWDHDATERHASWATVTSIEPAGLDALDWPATGRTDPPQLTGRWRAADYVDAYRLYYANDKRHLFAWRKDRSAPPWLDDYTLPDGATDHPFG